MKKVISILLLALLLGGCSGEKRGQDTGEEKLSVKELQADAGKRRYPIEQGIIRSTSKAMSMKMEIVTYFDKWGEWEAIETTVPMEVMGEDYSSHTLEIIKGDDHWKIDLDKKSGEHYKQTRAINPLGVDVESLTDELLGKMKMEDLGEVEFLGYKCRKMRIRSDKGTEVEYVMWGNVMMKMEGETMGIATSSEVISVEEVAPPQEKFEIPSDIVITESE
jgi:hypothetical protein